jgi:hypothetical protein
VKDSTESLHPLAEKEMFSASRSKVFYDNQSCLVRKYTLLLFATGQGEPLHGQGQNFPSRQMLSNFAFFLPKKYHLTKKGFLQSITAGQVVEVEHVSIDDHVEQLIHVPSRILTAQTYLPNNILHTGCMFTCLIERLQGDIFEPFGGFMIQF